MWIVVKEEVKGKKDHMEGMSPGDKKLNYGLFPALHCIEFFSMQCGSCRK